MDMLLYEIKPERWRLLMIVNVGRLDRLVRLLLAGALFYLLH
jgi:hypothetical protein